LGRRKLPSKRNLRHLSGSEEGNIYLGKKIGGCGNRPKGAKGKDAKDIKTPQSHYSTKTTT